MPRPYRNPRSLWKNDSSLCDVRYTGGGAKGATAEGSKKAQAPAAAPAATSEGDPSKLDMRVGVIVKAWEHPDSEKLFCEEIDLGEVGRKEG